MKLEPAGAPNTTRRPGAFANADVPIPSAPPSGSDLHYTVQQSRAEGRPASTAPVVTEIARIWMTSRTQTSRIPSYRQGKVHGPSTKEKTEYVEAVRVRLGACGPPDVAVCGLCGRAQLDYRGRHNAALSESPRRGKTPSATASTDLRPCQPCDGAGDTGSRLVKTSGTPC